MSITFQVRGVSPIYTFESARPTALNVNQRNALEIFERLSIEAPKDGDWFGSLPAYEVAERCRDALRSIDALLDVGLESRSLGRVIEVGRAAGFINERLRELLDIATRAGERGTIDWA